MKLYDRGDYLRARTKFELAYERSKHPDPILWLYETDTKLSRYTHMFRWLTLYIENASPNITPDKRRNACKAISSVAKNIGALRILSSEAGATVTLDDNKVGMTPLLVDLQDPGVRGRPGVLGVDSDRTVVLRIEKDGFKPYTWKGVVPAGQEITLDATLKKETLESYLNVDTEPGNLVSLDGKPVAGGPWEQKVPSGPHTLVVSGPLLSPYSLDLTLQDNTPRNVVARLEPAIPPWVFALSGVLLAGATTLGAVFLFQPAYRGGNVGSPGYVELSSGGRP